MIGSRKTSGEKGAIAVLESTLRTLIAAKADGKIVASFTSLVEFVKSADGSIVFEGELFPSRRIETNRTQEDYRSLNLDDVDRLLTDDAISRQQLEDIAIVRFGVPKGSMRKWGSKDSLREKISSMMRNERMHRTIGEVARRNNREQES